MSSMRQFALMVIALLSADNAFCLDLEVLEGGLVYAERGEYADCGREWMRVGRSLSTEGASSVDQQSAGFAFVGASRCYERDASARAYAAWAQGIQKFLEAGTDWTELREQIIERMIKTETQLSRQTSDEAGIEATLDLESTLLYRLDSELDLLSFVGPRSGLRGSTQKLDRKSSKRSKVKQIPAYIPKIFADRKEADRVDSDPAGEFDIPLSGGVLWRSGEHVKPAFVDYEELTVVDDTTTVLPIAIGPDDSDTLDVGELSEDQISDSSGRNRLGPSVPTSDAPGIDESTLYPAPVPGPGPWHEDSPSAAGLQGWEPSPVMRVEPRAEEGITDAWDVESNWDEFEPSKVESEWWDKPLPESAPPTNWK